VTTLKTQWLQGLQGAEKEQHARDVSNFISGPYVKQLLGILKKYEDTLDRGEINPSAYDNPNWAYRQAHINGEHHALKIIKDLLILT
jgi:hypothetical protein